MYVKELPRSATFANHFGSWNRSKKLIFKNETLIVRRMPQERYTKETLLHSAFKHPEHIKKTQGQWNDYSKKNKLPSAGTFTRYFDSWNKVQQAVSDTKKEVKK